MGYWDGKDAQEGGSGIRNTFCKDDFALVSYFIHGRGSHDLNISEISFVSYVG
jgi:hypothetical protein